VKIDSEVKLSSRKAADLSDSDHSEDGVIEDEHDGSKEMQINESMINWNAKDTTKLQHTNLVNLNRQTSNQFGPGRLVQKMSSTFPAKTNEIKHGQSPYS